MWARVVAYWIALDYWIWIMDISLRLRSKLWWHPRHFDHEAWNMFQERNNRVGYGNYSNMLCRLISNFRFLSRGKGSFCLKILMFSSMLLSFWKTSFVFKTFWKLNLKFSINYTKRFVFPLDLNLFCFLVESDKLMTRG